jgi:hypothetical protein
MAGLSADDLLEEGNALARDCVLLSPDGKGRVAGIWYGPCAGISPSEGMDEKERSIPWVTVDCRAFPDAVRGELGGWLSVFTGDGDDNAGAKITPDGRDKVAPHAEGVPLYARKAKSLPPLDGIFLLGPARVARWLRDNGWSRNDPYNDNFKDRKPAEAYNRIWQDQCPLYSGGAHVQLGGWSMPWPDGDWKKRIKDELLIWTFADSEPWLEVWRRKHELEVVERIT